MAYLKLIPVAVRVLVIFFLRVELNHVEVGQLDWLHHRNWLFHPVQRDLFTVMTVRLEEKSAKFAMNNHRLACLYVPSLRIEWEGAQV